MKRAEAGAFAATLGGLATQAFAEVTEGGDMMSQSTRWMGDGVSSGMWIWTVVGVLAAVALVFFIVKAVKK